MIEDFPTIKIIPLNKLVPHEYHDDQRALPLAERLKSSGVLSNPPMVMPFNDGTDRYMVLDGSNRTAALTQMSYPHIIAQITEPDSPNLDQKTWNHILWEYSTESLLETIENIPNLHLEEAKPTQELDHLWEKHVLLYLQTPSNKSYQVTTSSDSITELVEQLNQVVNTYINKAKLDRTSFNNITDFKKIHQDVCALVVFPHFQPQEVLDLCGNGHLMPAGITRFIVSPRALRINYPLDELASSRSLEEKNLSLDQWMQERIARKGVRLYSESTLLFDE